MPIEDFKTSMLGHSESGKSSSASGLDAGANGFANGGAPKCASDQVGGWTASGCALSAKEWVGIIANRSSGTGGGQSLVHRLAQELNRLGLQTEIAWTPDDRHALVKQASRDLGCRCLVAVGGDGTVSALINEHPRVPLTVLPAGTENLAAQHFGLRPNPTWLARTIAAGEVHRADVGRLGDRRFLLMAGFGFDGDVVTRHHRSRTTRSGRVKPTHRAAYVEPILRSSLFYRFPTISVAIEDHGREEILRGSTVFVFNLPRYALGLPFAPQACQDDGLLDLVVFRDPGPFQALYYLWRVFCGTHLDHPGVAHRRIRRVVLASDTAVPVQLDGDPAGFLARSAGLPHGLAETALEPTVETGWTVEVVPGAIDVLAPRRLVPPAPFPLARSRVSG